MPYDFKDPKLQFSKLRGAIYQACADRHFATHFAHALFLHKTHLFEPEAICVYSALNGWRRAFTMPDVARFVLEHINDPCCRQTKDKGPLTILAQDIDWLGCSFDVNTASHRRCKRMVACDASVIASWRTALTELVHDLTVVLDKF